MDKLIPGVEGKYAAGYENFEKDILMRSSNLLSI